MTNIKKYSLKIISIFLVLVFCISGVAVLADTPPDGYSSWDEYYEALIYGEQTQTVEVPSISEMKTIAENKNFKMLFDESGLDFYLQDKNSDKVWASAVHSDLMELKNANQESVSSLVDVILSTPEGEISTKVLVDSASADFSVTNEEIENGILFKISMPNDSVSFDLQITLDENGIEVEIPEKSIVEDGNMLILSLDVLPSFGITAVGEDGYIFYPDGSGALMNIRDYAPKISESYSWPLYGMDVSNGDTYIERQEQEIKNLQLPVFGVKQNEGGFFAAVTAGDTSADFNIQVSDYYRAWFRFDYRIHTSAEFNYTGGAFGGGSISKLLPKRIAGDRKIKYFLLKGEKNTYSDMAVEYRNYLQKTGVLKDLSNDTTIPVSVDLLMSATKNGMLGNQLVKMTSYEDALNIAKELQKSLNNFDMRLLGWAKGGYEAAPTVFGTESALGSKGDLENLGETLSSKGNKLYFGTNLLLADSEQGSYNGKKDVLRDLLGTPVTDYDKKMFFINAKATFSSKIDKGIDYVGNNGIISLDGLGNLLLPNLFEDDTIDRTEMANVYHDAMDKIVKANGSVAVSGGNYYVLKYADRIFELAETDSGYYQNDIAVPFYQMVLHGSVQYTSQTGNLSGDIQKQKLRWIETGSIPSFFITEQSPTMLKDTGYSGVFSSQFSLWKESIISVSKEFNERLGDVWSQKMMKHEYLNDDLVCITYESGAKVYINYSNKAQKAAGIKIPANDYVVKGDNA